MKNFDIKKILNDFTEIFKSTNNLKLVLSLVLILFILLFVVFGGCSGCGCSGCIDVSCHGCASSSDAEPDKDDDSGKKDDDDSGKDMAITLYEDSEIGYYPAALEEDDIALTFYFPADKFVGTDNVENTCDGWYGTGIIPAEGNTESGIAFVPLFDRVTNVWNSALSANATTLDEALEAHRANALYGNDPIGTVNVGGKDCMWRVIGGYVEVIVPFDHTGDWYAMIDIVPVGMDLYSEASISDSVDLIYNDEVRAILGAVKISDLNGISDDTSKVKFEVIPFADTSKAGSKLSWPSYGGAVKDIDQTLENGDCTLRVDSYEIAVDADGQNILVFNYEFTNKGDSVVRLGDTFYPSGFQGYDLELISDPTGNYIPVAPGRALAYQETYILDDPEGDIYLEVYNLIEQDGEFIFDDNSTFIDVYIAE